MTNAVSLGPKGIGALIRSSHLSLEVLELEGSSQMEPEQSEQQNSYSHIRLSRLVAQCPLLRRLRLQSVRTRRDIFAHDDVAWSGKVQICLGVNSSFQVPQFCIKFLITHGCFMKSRTRPDENIVEIEIFTSRFIFEPRCALVHGDFPTTHAVRQPWLVEKKESRRNMQMAGYARAFPFCITENELKDGLNKGYVWL